MAENSSSERQLTALHSKRINFFHRFRPVYYFARTLGFLPFSIVCDSNGSVQAPNIRVFDILWFTIAMSIYILSAIIVTRSTEYLEFGSNIEFAVLRITDYLLLVLMLLFGALIIAMDLCNRFKLVGILKNINAFDEEVKMYLMKKLNYRILFGTSNDIKFCRLHAGNGNRDFCQSWNGPSSGLDFLCRLLQCAIVFVSNTLGPWRLLFSQYTISTSS